MALDAPDLDDVTFEELREDALKRLPVLAPAWTDHNEHDPGITIIELLAWLVETYGYQLDQVTDEHRRKYLDLVGIRPRPPQRATGVLEVAVTAAVDASELEDTSWLLSPKTPVAATRPDGSRVSFEVSAGTRLAPASVDRVITETDRGRTDHTADNDRGDRHFPGLGRDGREGNVLYLGFDRDPFAASDRLTLAFHREGDSLAAALERDDEMAFEPSLQLQWEHCTRPDAWHDDDVWKPIEIERDGTTHLYRSGQLTLAVPTDWQDEHEAARILGVDIDRYWIRGRLVAEGDGRSSGPTRLEHPPLFERIGTNLVPVKHEWQATDVPLERRTDDEALPADVGPHHTTGEANQQFVFPVGPVVAAHVTVGDTRWEVVDDFSASSPDDPHCVLDRSAATVTFGDGRRGTIPPVGAEVIADCVTYGGGKAGNLDGEATWQFPAADAVRGGRVVESPSGGEEAEPLADAIARARDRTDRPTRAVTPADFRELALHTPAVDVQRAHAFVETTGDSCAVPPVTVVVVPEAPPHRRRSIPTEGFRAAVAAHLREHTLITDRVRVEAPRYVEVSVTTAITLEDGRSSDRVEETIREAVVAFLDPLAGTTGAGWPFERPVHRSELFALLEGLDGVEDVIDVSVGNGAVLAGDPTALPFPGSVTVRIEDQGQRCGRGF